MLDPIKELVTAIETDGKPSLAWVVRWGRDERDPVAAAWQRSFSPPDLVRVLEMVLHPSVLRAQEILRAPFLWGTTDTDRARAEAIRRLVPVPPTLAELLAAHNRFLMMVSYATAV